MIEMRLGEAAAALGARAAGGDVVFRGISTDSRTTPRDALFVAVRGPSFDGHDFVAGAVRRGAAAVLVERAPRETVPFILVRDSVRSFGRLAAAWRRRFHDLLPIAVTGSNGKTTVKEMIAAIFRTMGPVSATRGNLNNEIGVPLTLCDLDAAHRIAVVELGANHRGEIAALTTLVRPAVGVVTQCAPAHLEGFGSIEGVARAKGELFEHLPEDATAVVNAGDRYAALWRALAGRRRCISFGAGADADVRVRAASGAGGNPTGGNPPGGNPPGGNPIVLDTPAGTLEVDLPLPGTHNALNAAAAAAAATAADADPAAIRDGLAAVRPVKGRLESRRGPRNTEIIDDTYNANPVSLRAGLGVLGAKPAPRWLVLGDMGELGAGGAALHAGAGRDAKRHGVERLLVTGELSREAARAFGEGAACFEDCATLVDRLRDELPAGATVLVKGSRSMAMERVVEALVEEGRPC